MDFESFQKIFRSVVLSSDAFARANLGDLAAHQYVKYRIGSFVRPRVVCEFGVRAGYSGWAICKGASDAGVVPSYVGYDGDIDGNGKKFADHARGLVSTVSFSARLVQADTRKLSAESVRVPQGVNLFHVDADHSLAGARNELALAASVILPGGVILADDYDYIRDVRMAVEEFRHAHPDWLFASVPSWRGDVLLVRPR